ncbi:MAG: alpha/beta hydrolase [Pseudomonadota bacterium]
MEFIEVHNGEISLNVAIAGEGPLILCVHGWPELWYSWRHQIEYFAAQGYRVAALDVRGYGGSSKPHEISAYTLKNLGADVAAVGRHLSDEPVILLGHDWGAPTAYTTALLYPDQFRAVGLLSVPFVPITEHSFYDLFAANYEGKFFYQKYFQAEGVAEAELEADVATALRKVYYSISGDATDRAFLADKPEDAGLLDGMVDPQPMPGWMSEADLQVYAEAFSQGGFRGPINRYRAQRQDPAELSHLAGQLLPQPSCFIGGERDPVRYFIPGNDLYADPGRTCKDCRLVDIIPGAGHWVQQEAPDQTNQKLAEFFAML